MGDREYYPRFSGSEFERRYKLIHSEMENRGLDCLVIYGDAGKTTHNQANVRWVSNAVDFETFSYVIFPSRADLTMFVTLKHHVQGARARSVIDDVRWATYRPGLAIAKRLEELKMVKGQVGIVGDSTFATSSIPSDHIEDLKTELPHVKLQQATAWFERLQAVKSAEEIHWLQKAAEYTDIGMEACLKAIKPGVKEREVFAATWKAVLEAGGAYMFQLLGSTPMDNPTMHYPWPAIGAGSERTIKTGDIVMTEISADYWGYAGQIIRSVAVGQPTSQYKKLYELAYRAYNEIKDVLKPGSSDVDVRKVGKVFQDAGFKYDILAHGWGQNIAHPLLLREYSDEPSWIFENGNVIMIEPNPYTAVEKAGIFIGNLHYIDNEAKCFQKFPLEFYTVS